MLAHRKFQVGDKVLGTAYTDCFGAYHPETEVLTVISATHVAIQSETKTAGFTLRTGLTLKSRTYKLCAHASLVGGHWEVKVYALEKMSESTEVSFAKHLSAFISEWADQNPEALEEAARVEYNNDLRS